jgi:hypothetical protein
MNNQGSRRYFEKEFVDVGSHPGALAGSDNDG